jgi:RHS repeat-associated protein
MPFGEEIASGTGGRNSAQGYGGQDSIRQKFTAYERDTESGLDFAQARYYSSAHGRFTSTDPLASSASAGDPQSWNRYAYSYNNPLRYTDPSGMVAGDYYDQNGNWIGMDILDDGKNYLVTNQAEAQQIQQDTNNGMPISTPDDYTSLLELPSQAVRQEIGVDAVARSNSRTGGNTPTDDRRGGFHEEGGVVIQTANGQRAVPAQPGPVQDPTGTATINVLNMSNANAQVVASATSPVLETAYHIHPSGTTRNRDGSISYFVQPPSQADRNFAAQEPTRLGYHIVVGAGAAQVAGQNTGGQTVYFYNGTRTVGTMPLNRFVNLPARRPLPAFRAP